MSVKYIKSIILLTLFLKVGSDQHFADGKLQHNGSGYKVIKSFLNHIEVNIFGLLKSLTIKAISCTVWR